MLNNCFVFNLIVAFSPSFPPSFSFSFSLCFQLSVMQNVKKMKFMFEIKNFAEIIFNQTGLSIKQLSKIKRFWKNIDVIMKFQLSIDFFDQFQIMNVIHDQILFRCLKNKFIAYLNEMCWFFSIKMLHVNALINNTFVTFFDVVLIDANV